MASIDLFARGDYSGDVNLEYGGVFFDLNQREYDWGYVSAVRVEDLDSACGFSGAVLIERVVINGTDDVTRVTASARFCGWEADVAKVMAQALLGDRRAMMQVAESLLAYGHYDPDGRSYTEPENETVQTDFDAPMTFDGWTAAKRIACKDLAGYVIAKHVDWTPEVAK